MSVQGLGTDEESLIEIVCSRSNAELVEIKKVYKECKSENVHKSKSLACTDEQEQQQVNVCMCMRSVQKGPGEGCGWRHLRRLRQAAARPSGGEELSHSVHDATLVTCTAY